VDLIGLKPNTTWQLPADLAATDRGERSYRSLHGLLSSPDGRLGTNGPVAEFCIVLAILDLHQRGESLQQTRTGTGEDETSNAVLRDMSGDALLFTIQRLWPDGDRDQGALRREVQFLIDHGAGLLREATFEGLCAALVSPLARALELR